MSRPEDNNVADRPAPPRWIKPLIASVFIGGLVAFFVLGGDEWLSLEALKSHRDALLSYTEQHYWSVLVAALVGYTIAVALSIPGAVILSLALGLMFGRWMGTALILIAATLGATLVFLAARYLFAAAARRRLGARAQKIIAGFHDDAFHYLLFLRLVPLFPFWLVNLVPAFTPISTRVYVAATAIGILPGSFVFANLGQSLGRIDSAGELVSSETLAAFALLGVFALMPVAIRKWRAKASASNTPADQAGHD